MNDNRNFILIVPSSKSAYELIRNLVPILQRAAYTTYIVSLDKDGAESLLGVKVIELPECNNSSNLFTALRSIISLRKVMRKLKSDAVLGYITAPATYGAIAARMSGVRSISVLIDQMDYLSFFHKIGYRLAHNIIFDDYNNRYVSELFDLLKRDKAIVINGYGLREEKRWTEKSCEQLLGAMNLYV